MAELCVRAAPRQTACLGASAHVIAGRARTALVLRSRCQLTSRRGAAAPRRTPARTWCVYTSASVAITTTITHAIAWPAARRASIWMTKRPRNLVDYTRFSSCRNLVLESRYGSVEKNSYCLKRSIPPHLTGVQHREWTSCAEQHRMIFFIFNFVPGGMTSVYNAT